MQLRSKLKVKHPIEPKYLEISPIGQIYLARLSMLMFPFKLRFIVNGNNNYFLNDNILSWLHFHLREDSNFLEHGKVKSGSVLHQSLIWLIVEFERWNNWCEIRLNINCCECHINMQTDVLGKAIDPSEMSPIWSVSIQSRLNFQI